MEHRLAQATVALSEALQRGDAPAAAALYAEDGQLLASTAEIFRGRSQIEEYWRAGIVCGLTELELQTLQLQVVQELAIEVGRYVVALDGDGAAGRDRGKYVVLHRRQADGTWQRAVEVFNPDVPAAQRPDDKGEQ